MINYSMWLNYNPSVPFIAEKVSLDSGTGNEIDQLRVLSTA